MHYMLEFLLLDDNDLILATTIVESKRSTTSGKFISLNEKAIKSNCFYLPS